jgi:hypothetical protein
MAKSTTRKEQIQEFKSGNGNKYVIEGKKLYEHKKSKLQYVIKFLIGALLVVIVYDWFKDVGREMSSYNDLLSGRTSSGLAKFVGFTPGNFKRGVAKVGLLILLLIVNAYDSKKNKREITAEELPADVKAQVLKALE